jgi:hypothetical protein
MDRAQRSADVVEIFAVDNRSMAGGQLHFGAFKGGKPLVRKLRLDNGRCRAGDAYGAADRAIIVRARIIFLGLGRYGRANRAMCRESARHEGLPSTLLPNGMHRQKALARIRQVKRIGFAQLPDV